MLILTRKEGESLYIGDDIKITVLGTQGKQTRLGITLPDSMTVYREEIYKLVAADNTLARQSQKDKIHNGDIPKIHEIETRLGLQKISADKIIHFPKGIIGYEDEQNFTLLQVAEDSPFFMLQSTKTLELGLIVADPYMFVDDYSIKISDAEQGIIQVKNSQDLLVFVTVTIPYGKPDQTALNLSGPIFINHEKRIGLQIPQDVKTRTVFLSECIEQQKNDKEEKSDAEEKNIKI